ncbi:MAG TPA: hypothetical protein VM890_06850 [Longimicrobium sp.]|jgi:hypothetical protein|nr:hypothetical protein [Longimicrobium sp.]
MLIYEKDPRCWLAQLSDLEADPMPERVREHQAAIRTILAWARAFLTQPHPELGRTGPVCPFVRPALARGTIFYTVCPGADLDVDQVESVARSYRDWFLELEPVGGRDAQYKSINIIFPDVPASAMERVVEGAQERLKLLYARERIMLGEFHPGPPQKGGLWNEHFRPLRSPLPLLGIRHMVPTDFAFLRDSRELTEVYLAAFGDRVPDALAETVRAAALRFGLPYEGDSPGAGRRTGTAGRTGAGRRAGDQARVKADVKAVAAAAAGTGGAEAAAAGCPHHAAAVRAAAEAGCPAHAEPGAGAEVRVPVGRIVAGDAAGAGARASTTSVPPIPTGETKR